MKQLEQAARELIAICDAEPENCSLEKAQAMRNLRAAIAQRQEPAPGDARPPAREPESVAASLRQAAMSADSGYAVDTELLADAADVIDRLLDAAPVSAPDGERREPEREAAERIYTTTALDYARSPVGSRDWALFWKGWCAKATHAAAHEAVPREPTETMIDEAIELAAEMDIVLSRNAAIVLWRGMHDEYDAALSGQGEGGAGT